MLRRMRESAGASNCQKLLIQPQGCYCVLQHPAYSLEGETRRADSNMNK